MGELANLKIAKCSLFGSCANQELLLAYPMRNTQRSHGIGQLFENPCLEGVRSAPTVPATASRYREEHVDVNKGPPKMPWAHVWYYDSVG